jgi:ligand-binding SRPBCC domain-containing protein
MPTLTIETLIAAPQQLCFDLARDAAFHVESARETGERIVAGKAEGYFELGDEVVFEGRHLGVKQRLGARIVAMDAPHRFVDEMTKGVFRSLRHSHQFDALSENQTLMTDVIEWRSPLGLLGVIADKIAVEAHLRQFLKIRCQRLKERAESRESRR